MTQAIRIHANGGPEVMNWEDVPTPEPGPGEALVRHEAVGLNYIDVYFRTGLYKAPLPSTPGMEAAGVVVAVGSGVTEVKPGDPRQWPARRRRHRSALRHRPRDRRA
jgi:NADPH:quinone reductase